jgi:hypothetical protein
VKTLSLLCAWASALSALRAQTTVFQEHFTTATWSISLSAYGSGSDGHDWFGYTGAAATSARDAVSNGSNDTWTVAGAGATGSSGNPSTSPGGFLYAHNGATATGQIFAAVSTFASMEVPAGSIISWTMGNTQTNTSVRLLVQASGNWYASDTVFKSPASIASSTTFNDTATENVTFTFAFDPASSNWKSFTLEENKAMSLGSVAGGNLSSNAITGIGFYVADLGNGYTGQAARFDTLTIVTPAIPEPATSGVLVAGIVLAAAMLRRRTRA